MTKSTIFCAALLGALATPAFADGWRFVDGEAVWGYVSDTSNNKTREIDNKTREQVKRERTDFERNPVTADGWRQVGGEAGWIYVGAQPSTRPSRLN